MRQIYYSKNNYNCSTIDLAISVFKIYNKYFYNVIMQIYFVHFKGMNIEYYSTYKKYFHTHN